MTQHTYKRLPISMPRAALDEPIHIASSSAKSQRIKDKLFHGLLASITGYTSAS